MTMKAAQDMARKRWRGATEADKSEHGKMMNAERNKTMTPEERKESASRAAKARWAKAKKTAKKK